ncbi:MAG TPA: peptidoglycan bridge formation glycyltransferase FemA/FemB family protein [Patescibacteria group bacterium]|nr:peptidoglycan bridge formation glycyltransferase FemA/FemB family protein [Patescibacteria group bacterium]
MDIRQSPQYAAYLKSLGWQMEKIGSHYFFLKKIPFLGFLLKVQRIALSTPFGEIEKLAAKYRPFQIIIEPAVGKTAETLPAGFRPYRSPFIPTKTLIKDLRETEDKILASFSKNKRRDIRLAGKKELITKEGTVADFVTLKKDYLLRKFILPFGTEREIELLCQAFGEKAKILVAESEGKVVAATLLLFHNQVAYYWQAAATSRGKKLLAPTLLVWESIKLAKKKGCTTFDFEGIYDERFPQNKSWLGFTNFKEGFRGKEVQYPLPIIINLKLSRLISKLRR